MTDDPLLRMVAQQRGQQAENQLTDPQWITLLGAAVEQMDDGALIGLMGIVAAEMASRFGPARTAQAMGDAVGDAVTVVAKIEYTHVNPPEDGHEVVPHYAASGEWVCNMCHGKIRAGVVK